MNIGGVTKNGEMIPYMCGDRLSRLTERFGYVMAGSASMRGEPSVWRRASGLSNGGMVSARLKAGGGGGGRSSSLSTLMLLVASQSSWDVAVPDSSLARSEVASVLHTLLSDDSARKLRPTTDAREDIELGKPVDWTGDGQNQRGLMTITTHTSLTQSVPDDRLLVKGCRVHPQVSTTIRSRIRCSADVTLA